MLVRVLDVLVVVIAVEVRVSDVSVAVLVAVRVIVRVLVHGERCHRRLRRRPCSCDPYTAAMPDVAMPRLSDSMEEGTILKWLKSDGDEV